jgi:hypothetical protein
MWGDTRGWILSVVIAVLMGALLVMAIWPQGITPPTGTLTLAMQPATIPDDPSTVLPAPTKDCDAAETYRQAIDEYLSHELRYENWRKKVGEAMKADPPAVKMLLDARDCAKMNLFTNSPQDVMTYNERTNLDALAQVGSLCNAIALGFARQSSIAEEAHDDAKAKASAEQARRYAEAGFNLGRHLYEERLVFYEWSEGINTMNEAVTALGAVEKDKSRVDVLKAFLVDATEFRRGKVQRLWEVVSGVGDQDTAKYAGDIFQIARHGPERMWRVEAILKLGRFKYHAATRGDVYGARKVVAQLAADGNADPAVRAAAEAANNLTVEQFRGLN